MRLLVPIAVVLLAPAAHAGTVIVGACKVGTHLPTIQQAVNASAPGGTVAICPGTYPEQVTVTENLTLEAIAGSPGNQVVIAAPAGGVVVNANYLGTTYPVAAQVLVQNATVAIRGITVDGAGNGIAGCSPDLVGILYQNASGTIADAWVRNQFIAPFSSLGGCQSGQGIWAETLGATANVTVTGTTVQAFQKNGITGNNTGLNLTLSGDTLYGMGATQGAGENGVQISFGAAATLSGNRVGDEIWAPDTFGDTGNAASGILVYDSANTKISNNTVSSTQYGIAVVSDGAMSADGAQLTRNTIDRTYLYDAIDICGAGSATLTSNRADGADESGIHLDSSCGAPSVNNVLTGNTFNGTCAGVLEGAGSGGTVTAETFYNTASTVLTGTDVCTTALAARRGARALPRPVHH